MVGDSLAYLIVQTCENVHILLHLLDRDLLIRYMLG